MSYHELRSSNVLARKEHLCSWCGEKIEKGLVYRSRAGVFDREFQANREHAECAKAMESYDWNENDYGYMPHSYKRGTIEQK